MGGEKKSQRKLTQKNDQSKLGVFGFAKELGPRRCERQQRERNVKKDGRRDEARSNRHATSEVCSLGQEKNKKKNFRNAKNSPSTPRRKNLDKNRGSGREQK